MPLGPMVTARWCSMAMKAMVHTANAIQLLRSPMVSTIVTTRRSHAVLAAGTASPWLFPGGQPGRPISADRLGARLRALGLRPAQVRSTALFQLATELPAAVLARLLGIHINVAVQWQQHSAGDWTNYAADLSRRPQSLVSNHEVPG
jgi:hypothetical protein